MLRSSAPGNTGNLPVCQKSISHSVITLIVFLLFAGWANAQSTANYTVTTNTNGSLALDLNSNPLNMSSGTTQLVASSSDDTQSSLTGLNLGFGSGFDFYLMGQRYTNFAVTDNGVLSFGAQPATTQYTIPQGTTPTLAPFANDMRVGTDGKIEAKLFGTAPNRVLVVQWTKNMIRYLSTADVGTGTFQVRLYETSGVIEYVYGTMNTNSSSPTDYYVGFSVNTTANNIISINTNTNAVNTGASPTINSYLASASVTDLTSAADGSRKYYRFAPISSIAGPTGSIGFSSITATGMTLTWPAASPTTNVLRYVAYYSTDGGANYYFGNSVAVGTNTVAITGLTPGISYLWKIFSVSEGAFSSSFASGTQATTSAATYFYTGPATGDIGTAANWNTLANGSGSTRSSAQTSDILIIDGALTTAGSPVTLTIGAATSIGALQITSNTAVTFQSSSTTTRVLTLTGSAGNELDIQTGSSLLMNNATQAAQVIFSTGTGMTGNIAGTLTFGGSASNTITTTGGTGTLVTVQSTGIVNLTNTTIALIGAPASLSFAGGSNCNASGATTGAAPVPLATWATTANLTISGLTSSTTAPVNIEQSFGNIIVNCPAATGNTAWFAGTTGGLIKGDLNIQATGTGRVRLLGAGTLTVNGNINATGGNFDLMNGAATLTVGGNVNLSNAAKGNFANGAGTINIGGSVTVSNTATINIGNAATTNTTTISGDLNLNSSGTSAFALTSSTTLTLNINGNFSMTNGTFNPGTGSGSGTMKVKGNFNQSGGTISLTGSGTTGLIEFNGTSAQNVTFSSAMSGVISVRLNNAAGINLTGPLAINNGATYTISNGTTTGPGTITYGSTSGKLAYNSTTGVQTSNSLEFPVLNGPANLTINNTATAPNNIVSMAFSRTLAGTTGVLAMTAGILDNSANTLTIPNTVAAAVTGGSATSYVKGMLVRNLPAGFSTAATYSFPLGKAAYNAFELVNPTTNAGGPVTIQAEVIDANTGGTPGILMSSINTSRYWAASITAGAGNFTNSLIRLNDTRGTQDGIAASTALTGAYDHIGGATSTLAAGSITTTAPPVTSLAGFFVMGNLSGPALSSLQVTPTGNQCTNVARTITVTVTPGAGSITTVTLNYQVNGGSVQNVTMTNPSGNSWTGTIPTVIPSTATVTWSVTATDANSITATASGTSYNDEPLSGATASASGSASTVCSGSPVVLTAALSRPATVQVGGGTSTAGSGLAAFTNGRNFYGSYWGNARQEWLIRASELSGLGFTAGNITALSINVAAVGSPTTLNGFTIKLANTAATTLTTAFTTDVFSTVWGPTNYTPAVGTNTHTFTAPFVWDGVSNVVVDVCFSNQVIGGSSATNTYTAPGFNCGLNYGEDDVAGAGACTSTTITNSSLNSRPNIILTANKAPTPTGYSWSDGTNTVGSTNPLTVNPTINTSYTATVTAAGCPVVSNTVAITTVSLPGAPGANASTQCGTGIPAAFVTSSGGGGGFKWYDAQTAGNLLQTGGATYTGTINTTTHFWVSESNGTCESPRIEVLATVNQPDAVQASIDNNNPCSGTPVQLSAVQTTFSNGNTYTYSWSATPSVGSGISSPLSGTPVTVTPTAPGTYTYTVTAVDGQCTTISDVVVIVKALPVLNTPTANPAVICAGSSSSLAASTSVIAAGTSTIGAGAITTTNNSNSSTTYNSPFSHYWGGYKAQYLIKASELTAQNLVAGNITSLAFDIAAAGITYNGFAMNIAATSSTALTTTFISTGFTQVFSGNLAVTGTGLKTISFTTPFAWDGVSNIVVQVCWSNNNTGGTGAEVKTDNTAYVSTAQYHDDSQTPATICGITTASGVLSQRPKIVLGGQVITTGPGSLTYSWQPGSLSGASVSVSPSATTVYTVTATDPSTTCSNTATVTVTANPLPAAPSTVNGTDQCGTGLSDMSVSSNNTTDPQSPPFFNWYDAPAGGNLKQSGISTTYSTPISATTTLYVSEVSVNGCEGPRAQISSIVSDPDLLTVNATHATVCLGGSTDISSTYTPTFNSFATFDLTASPAPGSGVTGTISLTPNGTGDGSNPYTITPTATGTFTYTITGIDPDKGCTSVGAVIVTVGSIPVADSVRANPSTVCSGGTTSLSVYSGIITSGPQTAPSGYLASNATSTTDEDILKVVFGSLNNVSTCSTTGGPGSILNEYSNFTSVPAPTVTVGQSVPLTVQVGTCDGNFSNWTNVFIDYNRNGTFETNERVYTSSSSTSGAHNETGTVLIPLTASAGVTLMRVMVVEFGTNTDSPTGTYSWGESEDYLVNIQQVNTQNPALTYSWNPGSLSGATVTANPTGTTTYTATVTDPATGCSASLPVTVTVTAVGATATASPSTPVCAGTSVTLNGGATGGGPFTYSWTDGTTVVGTTSPLTVNPTVTTTYTVTVTDNCNNPATSSVTVNVNALPTAGIAETGPISICAPATQVLTAVTNAISPSYQWKLNGTNIPGATSSTYTVTSTGSYTVAIADAATGCTSNASAAVVVTINPKPSTVVVTPATTIICNGAIVNLAASVSTVSATSGTGASTSVGNTTASTLGPNPFQIYYGGDKQQSLYLASELTALGMGTGSVISAVKFNLPTADPSVSLASLRVKMKNTTTSSLTTTWESGMTIVRNAAAFPPAVGINTLTLNTPFTWDGTSNLVVEVTYSNNNTGTIGSIYNTAKYSPTSFPSTIFYRADDGTPASFNNYTGAVSFSYNSRNDMTFDFSNPGSITWSALTDLFTNAGATTAYTGTVANSVFARPSSTTTYTATATNTAGCTNTGTAVITVNPRPTGLISGAATYCNGQSTTTNLSIAVTGTGPWNGTINGSIPFNGNTSPISVPVTPSSTTTYSLTGLSDANCTSIAADLTGSATITINPRPTGALSGSGTYCNGQSTTTSLSIAVTGAGPWTGTLSPGDVPFSGSGSPISVSVAPSSTTTYTIATLNGSQCAAIAADLSGSATVTVNQRPTGSLSGSGTYCNGQSTTTSLSIAVTGAGPWTGTLSPGNIPFSGSASPISVSVSPSSTTTYTIATLNGSQCSAIAADLSGSASVTINPRPTATISGTGAFCQGAANTSTNLTVTFTGTAPWNYTYTTDGGSPVSGTTSSNPLTITVSPSSASAHVFTYAISALSDALCTAIEGDFNGTATVTINPLAAAPTATVSVQPTCSVGTGTVTVTNPLGSGNSYTLDGTTTINWPTVNFTGVAPGLHTITVTNAFGCSAPASTTVTVDPQPFIPGAPVVTGIVNVCPYLGVGPNPGTQVTYHATATGNGTQLFNWVIPPSNVAIVSGQGTPDLTVTFTGNYVNNGNKQIRLTVTNQCGTSPLTIFYTVTQLPGTPQPITGPTSVCNLIGTATPATYFIHTVSATGYNWTVPANTTVNHPNGPGVNDTLITLTFQAGFTGGNVTVTASNDCGTSGTRSLAIAFAVAATPGPINGPTNACAYTAPLGTAASYSVTPVSTATSYTWTAPAGAIVTHPNGSGANDNTITVLYPAGFTSGTIIVTSTNGCGTSGVRSLSITKLNPATPGVIDVVQTRFCGDVNGRAYTYALAAMPANATSVTWTIPAGATSVPVTPIKIEVTYPDGPVTGAVTAQGVNASCTSVVRSSNVLLPACPPPGFVKTGTKGSTVADVKGMEVKIFPNPTVSDFKLEVITARTEEITVRVLDNLGRLYKSFKVMPYQTIALGAELKAGSYLVEVRQGTEVKTTKVIKF